MVTHGFYGNSRTPHPLISYNNVVLRPKCHVTGLKEAVKYYLIGCVMLLKMFSSKTNQKKVEVGSSDSVWPLTCHGWRTHPTPLPHLQGHKDPPSV